MEVAMFKALQFFFHYGWRYDKAYVIEKILLQLSSSFVPLVAAVFPKLVIDELQEAQRADRLVLYILLLSGYMLLANMLSAFLRKDSFSHRLNVDAKFGQELHKMQARADYSTLESPEYLDLKRKAEKFITCDYHGFGYLLDCALDISGICITLISFIAILFMLDGYMILVFAATATLGGIAEFRAKKKANGLYDRVIAAQRGWMYYSGLFGDYKYGKEIRINRLTSWLLGREKQYLEEAISLMKRQNGYYIRSGIFGAACTFIQQIASYIWLSVAVIQTRIGIGDFAMYIAAVTAFGAAIRQAMNDLVEIRSYDRYFSDVERYLHLPATLRQGKQQTVSHVLHTITFSNVSFRYPGQDVWALRHINLTLHPGEKISIVGENGSGKSTLVKLLVRLYDVTEGEILLDGTDIRAYDLDSYMSLFGTVFQDFQLFSFSLRDNISFGRPCTDNDIWTLINESGLRDRTESLPRGIDTYINRQFDEHGFEPSGGEAQKIALARALCQDAPIVILDEPTAALDPRAEHDLYTRFAMLTEGKNAIFISHRLSSAQFCDRIVVLSGGEIVEYGVHDDLVRQNGLYAELYNLQSQFYK